MEVELCDVTPRDGDQSYGVNLSTDDKIWFARRDDALGVHMVEGGFPASNAIDEEVFRRLRDDPLRRTTLTAFGMTRRKGVAAEHDAGLRKLVELRPPSVTLVGKSARSHAEESLHVTPAENIDMIRDSIVYLLGQGITEVNFDAEHAFDGYREDPEYVLRVLQAACEAGAKRVILCDTRGGSTPDRVGRAVEEILRALPSQVIKGIHPHEDRRLGAANMLAAVQSGVRHVQGTWNGYGERTGNLDLIEAAANLDLEGYRTLTAEQIRALTAMSEDAARQTRQWRNPRQAFVGRNAYAHKGGMHASAVALDPTKYEASPPERWGNDRIIVGSKQAGLSNVRHLVERSVLLDETTKRQVLGNTQLQQRILREMKQLEEQNCSFERAHASMELLMLRALDQFEPKIKIERSTIQNVLGEPALATVKGSVNGKPGHFIESAEDDGQIGALSEALLKALRPRYPQIDQVRLVDYHLDKSPRSDESTHSVVLVTTEFTDGNERWFTAGASKNSIEAGWKAIVDALEFWLQKNANHDSADSVPAAA